MTSGGDAGRTSSAFRQTTVLHVINGEHYAGAERVQDLLAGRLPDRGYRVAFACLKRGKFQTRLEDGPYPSKLFPMVSRLDVLRQARAVARFARDNRVELIHSHTARSALIATLVSRLTGMPLVHHVHSPTERDTARWFINRVNAGVERLALANARALVPVSKSLEEHLLAAGYPADRITVIPNGVPLHEPTPPRTGGPLTIGMVALFRPRKGTEVLLEAMARLVARGVDVRLNAVGPFEESGYLRRLEGLAARLGLIERIDWRGFRNDVFAELAQVDLLVLPSLYGEGMPMVILEAMSAGVPVVATRIEGLHELVRHGSDGFLVESGSVEDLTGALARCASEPGLLATLGRQARQRQAQEFSDVAMAERLGAVYDRVLGVTTCERARAVG